MNFKLHHIGILVKDINKAATGYVEKLGYVIKSGIIHDPVQTALVQFLILGRDSPYVELITPDGTNGKLINAMKKGGGLNHLCYETDNIEKSYNNLVNKGMFSLQQPVDAASFPGRRITWLMGRDGIPIELVESGEDKWENP